MYLSFVVDKQEDINEFNKKVIITRIILGANISESDKTTLSKIAGEKNIPICQTKIDDSFFKLTVRD